MNLEKEIIIYAKENNLKVKDVNDLINNEISMLKGLIDEEAAFILLKKRRMLKDDEILFLDIDKNIDEAIDHFKTHEKAWIRNSAIKGCHVIVEDPCNKCKEYSDDKYEGINLFNNKGNNFANAVFQNCKSKETKKFKSINMIHLLNVDNGNHYYITKITDLVKVKDVTHYTFNSVITKTEEMQIRHNESEQSICKLMNDLEFKKFVSLTILIKEFNEFKAKIGSRF